MEHLNLQWFTWMAAGFHPQPAVLVLAQLLAVYGTLLTVAVVGWMWLLQRQERLYLLGTLLMCMLSVLLAHRLAVGIAHPRPFMLGLSPAYIDHAARGSMPSVHASALFTVAFCLLWSAPLRRAGWLALAVAAAVGWGRVYCGVHFPLDIIAGAALGLNMAVVHDWLWIRFGVAQLEADRAQAAAVTPFGSSD